VWRELEDDAIEMRRPAGARRTRGRTVGAAGRPRCEEVEVRQGWGRKVRWKWTSSSH
jgi:hypothetical protein